MTGRRGRGLRLLTDVTAFAPVRWAVNLRMFQFLLVLPTAAVVAVVVVSAAVGLEHPSVNFGAVFTWVVWWGVLLLSFVVLGRAWCLVCPVGALGEWLQRLSLWWRSPYTAGLNLPWPRRLRSMWLATGLFVVFVFLDNGYGMSNSPRMTAGLIAVITLAAAWMGLVFERRAFCRYVCPLTAFIGLNALASAFELRRRDPERCGAGCVSKDCFRGNEAHWGCPMGEYPGGAMDTNLYCILCTECVKSCPGENIALRLRAPGRDLWAMARPRLDGAFGASVVVGLATVVPLVVVVLLPGLRSLLAGLLPAGVPPNDPPRLVAVGLLLAAGSAASVALVYGFSAMSRLAVGDGAPTARALFARYAYALIPVGLAKLVADLLDHALRTWGAIPNVTNALLLDFPWNRVLPERLGVGHLLGPVPLYALETALLVVGLGWSLYALHRGSLGLFADREAGLASFLPMAGLALLLTWLSLWTLGLALL
ncbi:MAG TPA: 4Fe-4S binding protein [Methylomirabilota bacterium]|nr:4Fe-4S binding protein [Methylomirabilota bacterium]